MFLSLSLRIVRRDDGAGNLEKIHGRGRLPMDNATHDPQTSSKQQIYEAILRDLETVNPLKDKAFRILLADTGVFGMVVNAVTGDNVEPNCLYVFNNTIVLAVDGKGVVLDTVLESDGSIYTH